MDELAKAFKNFIYRDLFYILSGLMILLCGRQLGSLRVDEYLRDETALLLFYVGIAYALAIANQELWSQTPIVKTHPRTQYNGWLRWIYRNHTGQEWGKGDNLNDRSVCEDPDYLRAINIKQLGASLGASFLTCTILLGAAAAFREEKGAAPVAVICFVLAVIFIHVSWLHNMRQTAFKKKTGQS